LNIKYDWVDALLIVAMLAVIIRIIVGVILFDGKVDYGNISK